MVRSNDSELFILWRIENFDLMAAASYFYFCTPVIPTKKFVEFDMFVSISPLNSPSENISICLQQCLRVDGPPNTRLDVQFGLIDKNGDEQFTKTLSDWEIGQSFGCNVMTFLRKDVLFPNKDKYIPKGVLTVVCRIWPSSGKGGISWLKTNVRTEILFERLSFHWTIRNPYLFKRIMRVESDLVDGGFILECESSKENKNWLNFVIRLKVLDPSDEIIISATIQVCDRKEVLFKVETISAFDHANDKWCIGSLYISNPQKNSQDKVNLSCEFSVSKQNFNSYLEEICVLPRVKFQSDGNILKDDIRSVYKKTTRNLSPEPVHVTGRGNADIILKTSNGRMYILAHKMVLAARSPILNTILTDYDTEKKNWLHATGGAKPIGECKVTAGYYRFKVYMKQGLDTALVSNMSILTLSQMVECMYTDTLDIACIDDAMQLYMAGTHFDFFLLKSRSRDFLRSKVSLSTLKHLLPFAYEVGDRWLKNDFFDLIGKNRNLVFSSEEWSSTCATFKNLEQAVLTDLEPKCAFS